MMRGLYTLTAGLSLMLWAAMITLWMRGAGRAEGWYFRPSAAFEIRPPEPSLPSKWEMQWQINWDSNGRLSIARQVKPVADKPVRLGFLSTRNLPARWDPLPKQLPPDHPERVAGVYSYGEMTWVRRAKPATSITFLGMRYTSHEQEFGRYPIGGNYFAGYGWRGLQIPLVYLFILFALPPILWIRHARRTWRVSRFKRAGCCTACGYDLRGSEGWCPECGSSPKASRPTAAVAARDRSAATRSETGFPRDD